MIDEILYFETAKSIFSGKGFLFRGTVPPIKNIGLSLYLAPFFLIEDSTARLNCIMMVNCILFAISIVIVWHICSELEIDKKLKCICIVILIVWPDIVTARMVMSESLYWFFFTACNYYVVKVLKGKPKKKEGLLLGVLLYLLYLTKEVGLCLLLTYIIIVLYRVTIKYKTDRVLSYDQVVFFIPLFMFIVLYLITNMAIWGNFTSAYHQALKSSLETAPSLETLADGGSGSAFNHYNYYNELYFLYGFLYYAITISVSFFIIPLIMPGIIIKKLNSVEKTLYVYEIIYLLVSIIIIVLIITVREQPGQVIPRVHLRYLTPVITILFPLFIKAIQYYICEDPKTYKRSIIIVTVLFGSACLLFNKGAGYTTCVNENTALKYSMYLMNLISPIRGQGVGTLSFYPHALLINTVLIMYLIGAATSLLYRKHTLPFFVIIISAVSLINVCLSVRELKHIYGCNEKKKDAVNRIDSYIRENNHDPTVLFISNTWDEEDAVTFVSHSNISNCYYTTFNSFKKRVTTTDADLLDASFFVFDNNMFSGEFQLANIDYIVFGGNIGEHSYNISDLDPIPSLENNYYEVFHNNVTDDLRPSSNAFDTTIISLKAATYNADVAIVSTGLSEREEGFTWTDGNIARIHCDIRTDAQKGYVKFDLANVFGGAQKIIICDNNGNVVFNEIVTSESLDAISFTIDCSNGDCTFTILLPDAHSPKSVGYSEDTRLLGIALERMTIKSE